MNFADIVEILREKGQTVATMESCTGGLLASLITDIPNASSVFSYGLVTYSNEAKKKIGLDESIIRENTVYSIEVASSMAKVVCDISKSDYGIGITGRLGVEDKNNKGGDLMLVYFSIYDRKDDSFISQTISVTGKNRKEGKNQVLEVVHMRFKQILKQKKYNKIYH